MRKTFYELLADKKFDISEEYDKLIFLFAGEKCVGVDGYYNTIAAYIDRNYFRKLPNEIRGNSLNVSELMDSIELPLRSNKLEDIYLLCEFISAVLSPTVVAERKVLSDQAITIYRNINYILEKTNHQFKMDKNGNQIVVSKNSTAILAAEIVADENISFDLIEYNHYALKGNLSEKKKILSSIGLYIEPILRDKTLKESNYGKLLSDTGFVFNNFHIRHNNCTGPKEQEYTKNLSNKDLEKWYDKAYDLALAVIIAKECYSTQNELNDLKKNYVWKT